MKIGLILFEASPNQGSEAQMGWKSIELLANSKTNNNFVFILSNGPWSNRNKYRLELEPRLRSLNKNACSFVFISGKYSRIIDKFNSWLNPNPAGTGTFVLWWLGRQLDIIEAYWLSSKMHLDVLHLITPINYLLILPSLKRCQTIRGPWLVPNSVSLFWTKLLPFKTMSLEFFRYKMSRILFFVQRKLNKELFHISVSEDFCAELTKLKLPNRLLSDANGVTSLIDKGTTKNERLKVVWIGRLEFRKGLSLLEKLISRGVFSNCDLHIFGSGSQQSFVLESLVKYSNVYYRGHMNRDDLHEFLVTGDVILSTSYREAASHSMFESLSAGLVPVYLSVGGLSNMDSQDFSFPVKGTDLTIPIDQFSRAISILDGDRDNLLRCKLGAKDWAFHRNWNNYRNTLLEIYEDLNSA